MYIYISIYIYIYMQVSLHNISQGLKPISLQACKFTKNEFLHTHFSRILARF